MDVKEAVRLVISGDDLSFTQIKEAHEALRGTDYAEFTRLTVMARKKLNNVQDSLFGMSLDEILAAADVAETVTPEENKSSDEYKNMMNNIDAKLADFGYMTQAQRNFLENYSSQVYKGRIKWEDLTPEDRRLLIEEGKENATLAPSEKQMESAKKAEEKTVEEDKMPAKEEASAKDETPVKEEIPAAEKPAQETPNTTVPSDNNKEEDIVKPVIPGQEDYELNVPTEDANAALLNRNYSHMALFADSINPLDEKEDEFASSRDALDMLDVKDENNNSVDVREEIVETAKVQTMAELLASKDKISKEQFNKQFRNNIDMMVFSIINADRVAELTKSGDTKTMRKEFGEMVNQFTAGGKKNKVEVKIDNVIGALSVANQKIANVTDKIEKQFGKIPAVAAINNRLSKIDSKLTKKLGQKYVKAKAVVRGVSGIVTDLGLATLAGATGPVGMGIYAYYTFNKHAMPFFNAYKKETENSNISLSQYAKAHKGDAAMAGLYTVSSIFTAGIGAAVAAHNVATSAGATMADSFTKFATTGKIVAGATAVGTKQVLDIRDAYKNGTANDVAKAAAKAAGAIALFALAAEARNHYDLVPHGTGVDGAAGDTQTPSVVNNIVNNYYTTENNYYDYSSHDQVYIDNCCEPCDCDQNVPVTPTPTPVTPEPTPVTPEPTPVKPEPQPTPVTPAPTPVVPHPAPEPDPLPIATKPDHVSVAVEPAPEFVEREAAPEFIERENAPEFVEREQAPDLSGQDKPTPPAPAAETRSAPVPTQAPTERVLANGVKDYSDTTEMLNDFAKEGTTEMENKTFYDENKSTDKSVSAANNQTKAELVNHNQEVSKPIPTAGDMKAKDFNDVKALMDFLNGGNTQ